MDEGVTRDKALAFLVALLAVNHNFMVAEGYLGQADLTRERALDALQMVSNATDEEIEEAIQTATDLLAE